MRLKPNELSTLFLYTEERGYNVPEAEFNRYLADMQLLSTDGYKKAIIDAVVDLLPVFRDTFKIYSQAHGVVTKKLSSEQTDTSGDLYMFAGRGMGEMMQTNWTKLTFLYALALDETAATETLENYQIYIARLRDSLKATVLANKKSLLAVINYCVK